MSRRPPDLYAAEVRALGNIFAAETKNRLPFQSRAGVYKRLAYRGLVEPLEKRFGNPPFIVRVRGWQLTEVGRMKYCATCSSETVKVNDERTT